MNVTEKIRKIKTEDQTEQSMKEDLVKLLEDGFTIPSLIEDINETEDEGTGAYNYSADDLKTFLFKNKITY